MAHATSSDAMRMDSLSLSPRDAVDPLVLTGEQMLELAAVRKACRRVRRAVHVAALSGWTIALFAAVTLIAGLSTISATWMGLAMIITAFVELRARERLRRLDPSAARTLGYNQVVLGLLLVLYAAWNIDTLIVASPGPLTINFSAGDTAFHFEPNNAVFIRQFTLMLYGAMAIVAVLTQGSTAWYYFSRDKWIREYVSRTPSWILQIQRAGVGL